MWSRKVIPLFEQSSYLLSTMLPTMSIGVNLTISLLLALHFAGHHSKHSSPVVSPIRVAHLHHSHSHPASVVPTSNRSHKQSFNSGHQHSKRFTAKRSNSAREVKQSKPNWNQNENISNLLDQLLFGYDSHVRPNFGGPPIEVLIDFHIRSMGPISEIDMTYVIDCYFRQTWTDHRLAYKSMPIFEHTLTGNGTVSKGDPYNLRTPNQTQNTQPSNQKALALSIYMLDRIWKPPTYFLNSRQSHMHMITLPNKFVRIYSNGRVLYSSRMTIKANCPMNLENFPMDTQVLTVSEEKAELIPFRSEMSTNLRKLWVHLEGPGVQLESKPNSSNKSRHEDVPVRPDRGASPFPQQFNANFTASILQSYSVLVATFHFKRHMGSFVIEVYAPCIMLVVLSWVGFWINREATADRVTLGLTTVLTMTFLGLELRNDLPKVPYLTALDYFVYISFAFISATILEFGFVHFFTKIGSGEYYFMPIQDISHEESSRGTSNRKGSILSRRIDNGHMSRSADSIIYRSPNLEVKRSASWSMAARESHLNRNSIGTSGPSRRTIQVEYRPVAADSATYQQSGRLSAFRNSLRNRLRHSFRQRQRKSCLALDQNGVSGPVQETSIRVQLNSVSQIDRTSRVIFPIAFFIMNLIYWYIYLMAERNIDKHQLKLTDT